MKEKMIIREDMLFFGAYILYLTVAVIQHTQLSYMMPVPSILELLKIGAALVVGLKVILDKEYTGNQVVVFCFLAVIVVISCMCSGNLDLFCFFCFIFGIKDISYIKVLKIAFLINMIIIAIIAIGVCIGVIPNEMAGTIVWSNTMISDKFVARYNLGFGHPNTASAVVFFTTMLYMCIRNKCSFLELLISFGINFMVYQNTGSRTCFLITIVFLPLMYCFVNKRALQKCWQMFFMIASVIIVLGSTFMQIFYDPNNETLAELDSMLSRRLWLGHQGLLDYGITLFGQNILWINDPNNEYGLPYNIVDSAYMKILLENGIVVFIFLCIAVVMTMYYLVKIEDGKLCVAFLSLLVHSMVETSICDISWTPFCLLMGQMAILDNNKEQKDEK